MLFLINCPTIGIALGISVTLPRSGLCVAEYGTSREVQTIFPLLSLRRTSNFQISYISFKHPVLCSIKLFTVYYSKADTKKTERFYFESLHFLYKLIGNKLSFISQQKKIRENCSCPDVEVIFWWLKKVISIGFFITPPSSSIHKISWGKQKTCWPPTSGDSLKRLHYEELTAGLVHLSFTGQDPLCLLELKNARKENGKKMESTIVSPFLRLQISTAQGWSPLFPDKVFLGETTIHTNWQNRHTIPSSPTKHFTISEKKMD